MGQAFRLGQALEIVEDLASKDLPHGYGYEWTGIAYQEKQAGGTQGPIFAMAMIFVFLVLAAQYESWAVPFSVLLGLPIGVFGALLGVSLVGLENNVYVQIGIVAVMGLAAKNAILIVEFAKEYHEKQGLESGCRGNGRRKAAIPSYHDDGICLHSRSRSATLSRVARERRRALVSVSRYLREW